MPSVFKHISDEDLKLDKSQAESLTPSLSDRPKLTGIKVAICFSFLLALASLVGASLLYEALNSERREREGLMSSQQQFEDRARAMSNELDQYRSEVDRMREQLKSYGAERNDLRLALEQSQSEIGSLQLKIQNIEKRNRIQEPPIAALTPVAVTTPPVIQTPVETIPAVPVEPVVEKPPVAQEPQVPQVPVVQKPQPPIDPQVLSVNRKFNFVVVNLGLRDGLKIGDRLNIMRKGKRVGRVQIEKLYEKFSAATITKEPKNKPIAEGDAIQIA